MYIVLYPHLDYDLNSGNFKPDLQGFTILAQE